METITLRVGYDRRGKQQMSFRTATEQDVESFHRGQRVWFASNDGSARQVTISGQLKRWKKRTPQRNYTMEIPIKYGLWEHDHWRNCGCADDDFSRFLIPLEK